MAHYPKSVGVGTVGGVRLSRGWRTGLGNVKIEDVLAVWQGTDFFRRQQGPPRAVRRRGPRRGPCAARAKFVAEVDEGSATTGETRRGSCRPRHAHEHRRYVMFDSGIARVWGTAMRDMAAFGDGIYLYLRLLRALAVLFSVMTLLSVPTYMFSSAGSRIAAEDLDALTLSLVSVGNIGDSLAASPREACPSRTAPPAPSGAPLPPPS